MTNNEEFELDKAQLKALATVIDAITNKTVPLLQPHELAARSTLRNLQQEIDDHNALDDSDLLDTLNQARIEIKYLCSIITDLRERLHHLQTENARLERLAFNGI